MKVYNYMLAILIALALIGCGGGSSSSDTDSTPPVFTSLSTVSVNENQTNAIKLIATDEKSITYSITSGDSESFQVDTTTGIVTFKTAPDYETKNSYIFNAIASDGTNQTTQKVNITILNLEIEFLNNLSLSADSADTNVSTDIVAQVSLKIDDGLDINISKVELFKNDENITKLLDNGNVSNGDDIANDGVYSVKFTVLEDTQKDINYSVKVNNTYISTISTVSIIKPITDEEIAEINEITSKALNKIQSNVNYTESEIETKLQNIIQSLKENDKVSDVQILNDNSLITYTTNSGITTGISFSKKYTTTGEIEKTLGQTFSQKASLKSVTSSSSTAIGNKNVLILDPFEFQFGEYPVKNLLENNEYFSENITYKKNYDIQLEDFKNLSNYGVIAISTHSNSAGPILTSIEATTNLKKTYSSDIKKGRLFDTEHIILVEDGGLWYFDSEETKNVFYFYDTFITHYNKNLPDSLVILGMCSGQAEGNPLPQSFLNIGATTVFGYSDTVNSSYDENIISTLFEEMLNKKTVNEALDIAKEEHGDNDNDDTPAEPIISGDSNLKLFKEGLFNGSFEENQKHWTTNGDVRFISKLGSLKTKDGNLMSIISTGLGSNNDAISYIEQSFLVPENASSLTFDYDVISEEPMEFVGSEYDDKFEVHIIESSNDSIVVEESVNESSWNEINDINFDEGDDTTYHTGWQNSTIDISSYQGKNITLKFLIYDKGDSAYDTAALVDNVIIE